MNARNCQDITRIHSKNWAVKLSLKRIYVDLLGMDLWKRPWSGLNMGEWMMTSIVGLIRNDLFSIAEPYSKNCVLLSANGVHRIAEG